MQGDFHHADDCQERRDSWRGSSSFLGFRV